MKEFFESCLKDLEPVAGVKQYIYWQIEAGKGPDAKKEVTRQIEVCVKGMMLTCEQFTDITEEKQKKVIRRMMVEDNTYESMNSRTIYKWLNQYRQQQAPVSQYVEQDLTPEQKKVSPETQKMIDELLERTANKFIIPTENKEREKKKSMASDYLDRMTPEQAAMSKLRERWMWETHEIYIDHAVQRPDTLSFDEWIKTQP